MIVHLIYIYTANCDHNYMVNSSQKGMFLPLSAIFLDVSKEIKGRMQQGYFY